MEINISDGPEQLGKLAGMKASGLIRMTIEDKGQANIILATGTSQFATLEYLVNDTNIDWTKVTMFHLDEYIGLSGEHPASFRRYLKERFVSRVNITNYHLIDGMADSRKECERLKILIHQHPIDVAMIGIGENGHLAFNDPPADFETEEPYIVVNLDEACRRQQLGEGWFKTMADVPQQAISMSINQILKSKHIVCSVPDERKAVAVRNTLEHTVHNMFPATILQRHPNYYLYLDKASASQLSTTDSTSRR
jgi:glucosamine-6-phosphate deaminase